MAVAELASLNALAMSALEDGLSPSEAAEQIAESLSDDELRDALRIALPAYIGRIMRRDRSKIRNRSDAGGDSKNNRWARVSDDQWAVEMLRLQVCPRGQHKTFGECDARDVLDLAVDHRAQAEYADRQAKRHDLLGRLMNRDGHATVADVPRATLREIFNA